MKAVRVDADKRLAFVDVAEPMPERGEALVKVHAISLNRGETRRSLASKEGFMPGWDIAGVVETAAADGTGPKAGDRVVGLMRVGAWAEKLAIPTDYLAKIPDTVSFAQASCLPIAGLTALHGLSRRGNLIARKVLITGATGGVGHFATQLGNMSGAHVVAAVRSESQAAFAREHGAHTVAVVGDDLSSAGAHGPYDLILESVGGASLTAATKMLAPDGICVTFGVSGGTTAEIDIAPFYFTLGAQIYGLAVFHELQRVEPARIGLARLAGLVADNRLKVQISVEQPWAEIDTVARQLIDRKWSGKAVLHVS